MSREKVCLAYADAVMGKRNESFIKRFSQKTRGEIEVAKANVLVYKRNSVGIGEHQT